MPLPKDTSDTRFSLVLPADLRAALEVERERLEREKGLKCSAGSVARRLLWLGLARADRR